MLDLAKPRAWAGSLTFVAALSALSFAFFWLFVAAGARQPNVARTAAVSVAAALALEAIRRLRIAQLRKELADADDQAVVKISVNGVEVGEVPEPDFANMKLVVANDARNYVTQFSTAIAAIWRHAVLALTITAALLAIWLAWQCLVCPDAFAHAILAFIAASSAHSVPVDALAAELHAVAAAVACIYAMLFMLVMCARLTFGAPVSVSGAFRADLHRRVCLIVGTRAAGDVSLRRARAA
ncbi:hypothetical protein VSR34_29770 [Paraburkholderia sp. JHI2823]|uniref:hypothetical protein n=1 Tax=Paraburkholderia sp. JHI2823 TaxID=3112960 RepID=UPI00317522B9